jgi:hypothetical protein
MPIVKLGAQFFNHDAQAGGFFPNTHINQSFDVDKYLQQRGRNCIIEGIRGTGKTHILKMVADRYLKNFSEYKIVPVYMSLAELSQFSDDIQRFRMQLYSNLVLKSISFIEQNKEMFSYNTEKSTSTALFYLKKLFKIRDDKDFDATIREIKRLNQTLLQKLTYNPHNVSMRRADNQRISVQTRLFPLTSGNLDVGNETETEKKIDFIGTNLSHENAAAFILEYFKQLKQILGLSASLILLDECSESSRAGQVEVFRLLKLIRGASTETDMLQNYIYFLAAAYPPQATSYPSRLQGDSFNFDLGQDASIDYLQLDETLEEYESFFSELTKKRLRFLGGESFSSDKVSILDIFDSEKAFTLAAYAANGIPRRYIEILKQAYDNLQQRTSATAVSDDVAKLTVRDVESAIQIVVSNSILAQNRLNARDFALLDEIVNRFTRRNKKQETENAEKAQAVPAIVYFTISRSQMNDLANLIIQGAIHDKARTRVRKFYRDDALQGELMSLDLAVAFYNGAILKSRAAEIFKKDLKDNSKSGYVWCLDFDLTTFKAFKTNLSPDNAMFSK